MLRILESLKVFRNLFDSILPNMKSKTGGVIKDLTELKSSLQFSQEEIDDLKPLTGQMTKIEKEIEVQAQVDYHCDKVEYFANKGHVPRKSREVFGAEKPFVKLGPLNCLKLVFSYVVKGIKIKITAEFRASRSLRLKIQRESSHPKYA